MECSKREIKVKNLLLIILLAITPSLYAANTLTDYRLINDVYTYTSEDTLYVYLAGVSCPNTKNYFSVDPNRAANAKQLISMILAAKMAKASVNIMYDPDEDSTHCYIKGLWLRN